MSEPIVPLGSEVLVKEAEVDQAFASGRIDDASLTAKVTAESRLSANKAVSAAVANSESCRAVEREELPKGYGNIILHSDDRVQHGSAKRLTENEMSDF